MTHYTPDKFEFIRIGMLVGRAALLKDRILDTYLVPHGVTAAQFKVLMIILQGYDTPAELCRYLSLDSGSMTRMLDRLEQKKLIARIRSENDRRQVHLSLTDEGRALNALLPTIGAAAMNEFTAALTPVELQSLEDLLKKMLIAAGDTIVLERFGDV
ncbi:MAG: MarR family transcriptional regulator [Pseudomonas sp.]|uniref:MarR family winged helix-turn-helix transcriptional regulator n=1 Tax=Pseudomonas sp. TaxID=306 RepID=UPI0030F1FE22